MKRYDIKRGDCLEILKKLPNDSVDLVVTDPPYRTTARGNAGNSGGMLQKEINKKEKYFHTMKLHLIDIYQNYLEY